MNTILNILKLWQHVATTGKDGETVYRYDRIVVEPVKGEHHGMAVRVSGDWKGAPGPAIRAAEGRGQCYVPVGADWLQSPALATALAEAALILDHWDEIRTGPAPVQPTTGTVEFDTDPVLTFDAPEVLTHPGLVGRPVGTTFKLDGRPAVVTDTSTGQYQWQ